ncbi:MAG: hypothetical protein OEY19_12215 [Gammaproteobacteria bacterium]|nr:hypothetical protein [Gammaproteobacteria bacterium]MDH5630600.1 hypothetical protein [Gammaproteobacteria bacterium]
MKNIIILISLALSACASPFKPITEVDLKAVDGVNVISSIPQSNIERKYILSNGGANAGAQYGFFGSLVGAIIDSSVNEDIVKEANLDVELIIKALADYKANEVIESALKDKIDQTSLFKISGFQSSLTDKEKSSGFNNLLLIATTYKLSQDMTYLEIRSEYTLSGIKINSKNNKPQKQQLYKNVVTYNSSQINETNKEKLKSAWSENNAKLLREKIAEGANQVAQMILLDLNGHGLAKPEPGNKVAKHIISENEAGRLIYRMQNGELISEPTKI